ncbi:succinate-CoA ligase [Lactarius deliciosus]|nr:succinate-CoA ligase [Lactarius deliciosus]
MLASLRKAGSFARAASAGQRRFLSIHEYQSVNLLNSYGVPTPKGVAAKSPKEAIEAFNKVSAGKGAVIKAQVLAGGRGKGKFSNGLQAPEDAEKLAGQMIGSSLITKQTGAGGRVCNAVMLAELRQPSHEYYIAVLNDRASQGVVLVAAKDPNAIITTPIPLATGLTKGAALDVAKKLGFSPLDGAVLWSRVFLLLLWCRDGLTALLYSMDAKFGFDDNAEFRQQDEEPSEVEAQKAGLNFIKLDGNIGCLVNGAGLAMATMDVLSLHGGQPANFLDCRRVGVIPNPISGATPETVKKAFEILLADPKVKSIFINIFGGIMRCDYIAEGVIKATKELGLTVPLVVRLKGTKEVEAKEMIRQSGLKIIPFDGLDDAAERAVQLASS